MKCAQPHAQPKRKLVCASLILVTATLHLPRRVQAHRETPAKVSCC